MHPNVAVETEPVPLPDPPSAGASGPWPKTLLHLTRCPSPTAQYRSLYGQTKWVQYVGQAKDHGQMAAVADRPAALDRRRYFETRRIVVLSVYLMIVWSTGWARCGAAITTHAAAWDRHDASVAQTTGWANASQRTADSSLRVSVLPRFDIFLCTDVRREKESRCGALFLWASSNSEFCFFFCGRVWLMRVLRRLLIERG